MDALAVRPDYELPATIEDLSRFVLVGREKLVAVRAEIRAIDKVGLAKSVREQKLQEAQLISEAVLDAEVRIGQLMQNIPKESGGNHGNQYTRGKKDSGVVFGKQKSELIDNDSPKANAYNNPGGKLPHKNSNVDLCIPVGERRPETAEPQIIISEESKTECMTQPEERKTKAEIIKEAGFTSKQVQRFQQLAEHPDIVEAAKKEARENDDVVSRSLVLNMIRSQKKAEQIEHARADIANQSAGGHEAILRIGNGIGYIPDEPYDLLLTDPPYSTDVEDIDEFAHSWLPNALGHVKSTGSAYVFIGAYPEELRAYLKVKEPEHVKMYQD
ncbi:MAG: hypothetical protein IJQ77_06920 [Synergistaceae bacterium]|nr:hypothetical protein [Synergistaceae bacterium]